MAPRDGVGGGGLNARGILLAAPPYVGVAHKDDVLGRPARLFSRIRPWPVVALVVCLAVAGVLLGRAEGVRPVRIVSGSMVPAVAPNDWVIVRNVGAGNLDRGEIVLFRFPFGSDGRAIKRVVAVEGDTVAIDARGVTVGGRLIPVAAVPDRPPESPRVETVPAGHVFLLGDNSVASIDSRSFGSVPESELVGRVMVVVPAGAGTWLPGLVVVLVVGGLGLVAMSRRR